MTYRWPVIALCACMLALRLLWLSVRVDAQAETLGVYRELEAERVRSLHTERVLASACEDALTDLLIRVGVGRGPAGRYLEAVGGR